MRESSAKRLLRFLLIPVARYCFRHTLHLQDMLEVAKVVFVEQASREVELAGERVNVSRLSIMTGLHRRDVERIYKRQEIHEAPQGLLNRVLGQWQYDERFATKEREPRPLSCEREENEFHELVASVSSDINAGTVLFEMERRGLVVRDSSGKVVLQERVLSVSGEDSESRWEEGFSILSQDLADLTEAVEDNLVNARAVNLHGRTEFDCVDPHYESEIRKWLFKEGSLFHRKVRDYLAQFDRDVSPLKPESDVADGDESVRKQKFLRVSVGAFSFVAK